MEALDGFGLFADDNDGHGGDMTRETVRHVNDMSSSAARVFTGRANTEGLQEAIRYRVFVESGGRHVIGRQSDTELSIVMRSILLQHGKNNDSMDTGAQVRDLNARVLKYCVDNVLSQVDSYMTYRKDASQLYTPLRPPAASSVKGTGERSLQFGGSRFI